MDWTTGTSHSYVGTATESCPTRGEQATDSIPLRLSGLQLSYPSPLRWSNATQDWTLQHVKRALNLMHGHAAHGMVYSLTSTVPFAPQLSRFLQNIYSSHEECAWRPRDATPHISLLERQFVSRQIQANGCFSNDLP
ncbi:uncharacterized protein TrAFT101_009281 [Trichoderma asperellum]|uniref:uncharacterized protein n=1 Tax=Trichoderma asperellum TaxID=101201 RepID=UPI00333361D2|nr:hypothetical protein TrAFT101_009281 [Trichoderma asperellum]